MRRVVVAVPARDEADEIADCVRSVVAAADRARADGVCATVRVGVGVNRCTDRTALAVTEAEPGVRVLLDDESASAGGVRALLVERLTAGLPHDTWVFNTDADTRVPVDWISHTLQQVAGTGAVAVAGLVDLRDWAPGAAQRAAYGAVLAAGLRGTEHTHVYGANLAVRLDAYRRVGGFRAVHAEDQDLVDRLRLAGEVVATLHQPSVSTSAREQGRAPGGLGALLHRLRTEQPQV